MFETFEYLTVRLTKSGGVFYEYNQTRREPVDGPQFLACKNQHTGKGWFKWPCESYDEAKSYRKMLEPHCACVWAVTNGQDRHLVTVECDSANQYYDCMGLLMYLRHFSTEDLTPPKTEGSIVV